MVDKNRLTVDGTHHKQFGHSSDGTCIGRHLSG